MRKKRKWKKKLPFIGIFLLLITLSTIGIIEANRNENTLQYDVGNPSAGMEAPDIYLESTDGDTFDLSAKRGETVLLYFQEGIMCQACWVQLFDIEAILDTFEAYGVDQIVTITTDPIGPLRQMTEIYDFKTPILSDSDIEVSARYETNLYGMPGMGENYNGHTFILIDENGIIRWRADYGPYTMYVPVETILEKIEENLD